MPVIIVHFRAVNCDKQCNLHNILVIFNTLISSYLQGRGSDLELLASKCDTFLCASQFLLFIILCIMKVICVGKDILVNTHHALYIEEICAMYYIYLSKFSRSSYFLLYLFFTLCGVLFNDHIFVTHITIYFFPLHQAQVCHRIRKHLVCFQALCGFPAIDPHRMLCFHRSTFTIVSHHKL